MKSQIKQNPKDLIYYNIGKYVVEFESMLQTLFETMTDLLEQQSDLSLDAEYIESLLCELDAMTLVTKFYNLYGIKYKQDKHNLELIGKIYVRLKSIVEFRNLLVHSS